MTTNISRISIERLREAANAIDARYPKYEDMGKHQQDTVKIDGLTISLAQIRTEISDRHKRYDEKFKQFQWDMPHLYEHCLTEIQRPDLLEDREAYLDLLLKHLAAFATIANVKKCQACR